MLTFGSLFSGIGGMDLGLERSGMKCSWQVEIDPYCRKVLAKHWPDVERFEDVREVGAHNLRPVDLICGGFPCQPVSCAGQRKGTEDERWLWPEFARLVRELRPRWILGENVPGLLSIDDGRTFGTVLRDLAESGYAVEWDCIPAAAVNAPHRRDRVFIVAHAEGSLLRPIPCCARSREDPSQGESCSREIQEGVRRTHHGRPANTSEESEDVADAESIGRRKRGTGRAVAPGQGRGAKGKTADDDCSGLPDVQGQRPAAWPHGCRFLGSNDSEIRTSDFWRVEPDVGRVAYGIPFELVCIRRIDDYTKTKSDVTEADTTGIRRNLTGRFLRSVWEQKNLTEASPRLYQQRLLAGLPEMPHSDSYEGWYVGSRIEGDKGLRGMWEDFYAKPLEEAQQLQQDLLERIRQEKRPQAMASRVGRLRGLGNAVVPQVAEFIGRRIVEADKRTKEQATDGR